MLEKLKAVITGNKVRVEIPKSRVEEVAAGFKFRAEWTCPCGKQLKIRARQDRFHGPSNFRVDMNPKSRTFGHATLPSDKLTWNGLAAERGWIVDGGVKCPECQRAESK